MHMCAHTCILHGTIHTLVNIWLCFFLAKCSLTFLSLTFLILLSQRLQKSDIKCGWKRQTGTSSESFTHRFNVYTMTGNTKQQRELLISNGDHPFRVIFCNNSFIQLDCIWTWVELSYI